MKLAGIRARIALAFCAFLLVAIASALLTLANGRQIEQTTRLIAEQRLPGLLAVNALSQALEARQSMLYELYATTDGDSLQRLLQAKQLRDEMGVLMREVDNAQRVYDAALQRYAQSKLESQTNQPQAYVLTSAAPPGEPSSPKTKLYLSLSAALGLLLGVELVRDREAKTPDPDRAEAVLYACLARGLGQARVDDARPERVEVEEPAHHQQQH